MKNFSNSLIKLFIFSLIGILLLIFSAVALRAVVFLPAKAEETTYIHLPTSTPLYRNNDLSHEIITLPAGYYAKVLSSKNNLYRVEYNGVRGFIECDGDFLVTTPPTEPYQTAELKTKSDAGTYLRSEPSSTSTRLSLIPPETTLLFIGSISSMIPSDGITNLWYYVTYDMSETASINGYVYGERVNILSGMIERPETKPTYSTTLPTETDLSTTIEISSGLKIFLIVLFVVLGVIIFALLLISPRQTAEKPAEKIKSVEFSKELFSPHTTDHHKKIRRFVSTNERDHPHFFSSPEEK